MTEGLQNDNQDLANTLKTQKKRQKAMAVRSGNRQAAKLQRVRNMVNRIMLRQRFKQWVASSEYIISIEDGAKLGDKIFKKRRLRNNFNKYCEKIKAMRRADHINKRVQWFRETRENTCKNDCFQSWRLYMRKTQLAKKFLCRSSHSLDKQLLNEALSIWKKACALYRQAKYQENIKELDRRKAGHEESIAKFRIKIE